VTTDEVPEPDRPYNYVSVIDPDNPAKRGLLLGPYPTHAEALANVERGRKLAEEANPWACFFAFGTAGSAESRRTVFGK
jgi:hypothetical protein